MGFFRQESWHERITEILERERRAVLAGDFDVLQRLAAEKARALKAVPPATGAAQMTGLKRLLERNQALLEAAARGIRAAGATLARPPAGPAGLMTYGRSGERHAIGVPAPGTERRS